MLLYLDALLRLLCSASSVHPVLYVSFVTINSLSVCLDSLHRVHHFGDKAVDAEAAEVVWKHNTERQIKK